MQFQAMFRDFADRFAGQTAAALDGERESYAALRRRVDALSHSLRTMGCKVGSRVVYAKGAGIPYLEVFLAAVQLGAVFCPLSPRLPTEDFLQNLHRMEPDFLLAETDLLCLVAAELPACLPRQHCIAFGSTRQFVSYQSLVRRQFVFGQLTLPEDTPAIAILNEGTGQTEWTTHGQLCRWLAFCQAEARHPPGTALLCIPYSCLAYPLELCLGLACGDMLLPYGSFTPKDFIKAVSDEGVTSTLLTPSIVRAVAADSSFLIGDFSRLRHVRCGQAYFDQSTARSLQNLLPPDSVLEKYTLLSPCILRHTLPADSLCSGAWADGFALINAAGKPPEGCAVQVRDPKGAVLPPGQQGRLFLRRGEGSWEPLGPEGWVSGEGLIFLFGEEQRLGSGAAVHSGISNLAQLDEAEVLPLRACLSILDAVSPISPHQTTQDLTRQCCEAVLSQLPQCRAAALSAAQRSLQARIVRHYVIQELCFPATLPDPPTTFWVRSSDGPRPVEFEPGQLPSSLRLECHPIYTTGRQFLGSLYLAVPHRVRPNPRQQTTLLLLLRHIAPILASHQMLAESVTRLALYEKAIELAGDGIGISGLEAKPALLFVNSKSAQFINLGKMNPEFGALLEEIQTANFQDLRQGGTDRSSRSFFYLDPDHGKVWVNYRTERVTVGGEAYAIAYCNRREMGSGVTHLEGLLSGRELEVVRLVTEGLANKEIADRLQISVNTVKFHLTAIYKKMQVTNRAELLSSALLRNQ